jgi:hypothetical protein
MICGIGAVIGLRKAPFEFQDGELGFFAVTPDAELVERLKETSDPVHPGRIPLRTELAAISGWARRCLSLVVLGDTSRVLPAAM